MQSEGVAVDRNELSVLGEEDPGAAMDLLWCGPESADPLVATDVPKPLGRESGAGQTQKSQSLVPVCDGADHFRVRVHSRVASGKS